MYPNSRSMSTPRSAQGAGHVPKFHSVAGFKFAPGFQVSNIESGLAYEARPDDLFIVTYPKCGTTWAQQILVLIFNNGQLPDDLLANGVQNLSPFLECEGRKAAEEMARPGAIKTHLNYRLQPKHPSAKYIYVARNPKDACVSFFYHHKRHYSYDFQQGSFEEFVDAFIDGQLECASYWDHVNSWWEHRDDENVLFLTYEQMKLGPAEAVLKMAKFAGEEYGQRLTDNPQILEDIVRRSSFEFMSSGEMSKAFELKDTTRGNPEVKHIRKGVIGDFRNHFDEKLNKRIEDKTAAEFGGTGIDHLWDGLDIFTNEKA